MVYRAQRFDIAVFVLWDRTVDITGKQVFQQYFTDRRDITGKNEVSVTFGGCKRRFDSSQRAFAGAAVRNHGDSQFCICCGIANKRNSAANGRGPVSDPERRKAGSPC